MRSLNRTRVIFALLVVLSAIVFSLFLYLNFQSSSIGVSIFQLLSTPERFHKRSIVVAGYATIGNEDKVLYPSQEAATHLYPYNKIWLELDSEDDIFQEFNERHILIEGEFDAHFKIGSLSLGAIQNIKRIKTWPPDDEGFIYLNE